MQRCILVRTCKLSADEGGGQLLPPSLSAILSDARILKLGVGIQVIEIRILGAGHFNLHFEQCCQMESLDTNLVSTFNELSLIQSKNGSFPKKIQQKFCAQRSAECLHAIIMR